MRLTELTESEYSTVGITQAQDNFLQSPAWGLFQKSLGKEIRYFAVRDDAGEILLSALLIVNKIFGKSYAFGPFGPVFMVEEPRQLGVFNFFARELQKFIPDMIFLRFEPAEDFFSNKNFGRGSEEFSKKSKSPNVVKSADLNPHQTLLLDLRQNESDLLAAMKPKTRYNIKVAQKEGVGIRVLDEVPLPLSGEEDPFSASAQRAGVNTYSREYFSRLLKFFSENSKNKSEETSGRQEISNRQKITVRCYAAYHKSDLLAANIMLEHGNRSTYLFGGALDKKRNTMPSYLLHWQAILDAKSRGCTTYDFWGVETDERHPWYGFSKFKLGFGGTIEKRPGTYDFVYKSAWYNIYRILRKINRLKIIRKRF
jgi:lipid II:glycine glycyltransferase (peptidoglycan interpeptide bridge formation enzyme)